MVKLETILKGVTSNNFLLATEEEDFNAKNKIWFEQGNTVFGTFTIGDFMFQYELNQTIHETTHSCNQSTSCNDLILSSQEK